MKLLLLSAFLLFANMGAVSNSPVQHVDFKKYAGTWYSLYSIPTTFDRGSQKTTGKYKWNSKGYYDVTTICKEGDSGETKSVSSKVFPASRKSDGQLKAQFIWPIKIDYWIIELPEDYSYVVVGHPEHKFLFIMSRKTTMEPGLYKDILARCKSKGYDVSKLTSQMHDK